MLNKILIGGLTGAACVFVCPAQNPPPTVENMAYGEHARNTLHFWAAEGSSPRPLLIYIHGGAWISNDKGQIYGRVPIAAWLEKGVSVASIDYRYTRMAPLPAPVHDAARAVQFLRYKAEELNIDPSRIALQGGSAGGCSALWILFHDDLADPENPEPVLRQSSRVQGAAVQGAQSSIDPKILEEWIGPLAASNPMIFCAVGAKNYADLMADYSRYKPLLDEFSPINHLTADDPPLFAFYSADRTGPPSTTAEAIHHAQFGVKLKEEADRRGYTRMTLSVEENFNPIVFLETILLGKKNNETERP